ncbi:MAG: 2'-5' RNA ligase family protein [Roseobacter sp.]
MIYVLAVPQFDAAQSGRVESFRALHEPARARLVPAHLTLAFSLSRTPATEVIEQCQKLAADTPEFKVAFSRAETEFDKYEHTYKLLLTTSTGSALVKQLHRSLYDAFPLEEFDANLPYRPHMTVATHPKRKVIEALDISQLGRFPFFGRVKSLNVVSVSRGRVLQIGQHPLAM